MIWKNGYDTCTVTHSWNKKFKVLGNLQKCKNKQACKKVHRAKDALPKSEIENIMSKSPSVLLNEKWPVSVSVTEVLEVMVSLSLLYGFCLRL